MTTLQRWDPDADRATFPCVLVETASGASHLIDVSGDEWTVTRMRPEGREVDTVGVPDTPDGYHSGVSVLLRPLPDDDDGVSALLSGVRRDGDPVRLVDVAGEVRVGEPMTLVLDGVAPAGPTVRTTTAVVAITPALLAEHKG